MSTLLYRRLRLPINARDPLGPVDQATNNTPCMVQAGDYAIDVALFFGAPSTTTLVTDVTNFAGITFQVKAATNNGAAPAPDSSALISKTVAPWTAGTVTWANWLAASAQHATIILTAAETAIATGNAWMILIGTTTDLPPRKIPLACGPIVIVNDGYAPGVGPPAPIENYYTQSQVNALLALKATTTALTAETARATAAEAANDARALAAEALLDARLFGLLSRESISLDGSANANVLPPVMTDLAVNGVFTAFGVYWCPHETGDTAVSVPFDAFTGGFSLYVSPTIIGSDRLGVQGGASSAYLPRKEAFLFAYSRYANQTAKIWRTGAPTPMSNASDTNGYNFIGQYIGRVGSGNGVRFARLGILNFALTDAEAYDLHVTREGVIPVEWKGGSAAPLNSSSFTNGNSTLGGFSSFTGASTTGFTATATTASGAQSGPVFSVRKGQRIAVELTKSGTGAGSVQLVGTAGNVGAFQLISTGANSLVFVMSGASENVRIQINCGVGTIVVSQFVARFQFALWVMDDASRGNGPVLADVSQNAATHHVLMDGDGLKHGGVTRVSPFEGVQEIGPFSIPVGTGNYLVGGAEVRRIMEQYDVLGGRVYLADDSDDLDVALGFTSGGEEILTATGMGSGMNPFTVTNIMSPDRVWITDVGGAGFSAGALIWLNVAPKQ